MEGKEMLIQAFEIKGVRIETLASPVPSREVGGGKSGVSLALFQHAESDPQRKVYKRGGWEMRVEKGHFVECFCQVELLRES